YLSFDELWDDDVSPQTVLSLLAAPFLENIKNLFLRLLALSPEMEMEMLLSVVRLRTVENHFTGAWIVIEQCRSSIASAHKALGSWVVLDQCRSTFVSTHKAL